MRGRNLLSLDELSAGNVERLLEIGRALKQARLAGTEQPQLQGKNIAMLSPTCSPATRNTLEVAARDQGACVSCVGLAEARLGDPEVMAETARVLGRLYDAIDYRGSETATVRELTRHAGVPIYHDLTGPFRPTQMLADWLTMQEQCPGRSLAQMRLAYLGDARGEIGESLLQGAATIGLDLRIGAPRSLWPAQATRDAAQARAEASGARLRFTESLAEAADGVDFVYNDCWVAIDDPAAPWSARVARLQPYPQEPALMRTIGSPQTRYLHRIESPQAGIPSRGEACTVAAASVWQQAENRLHAIKSLLVATLA